MTEAEWNALSAQHDMALREQFDSRPDLHGKMFMPKPDGPRRGSVPTSFSVTLLAWAGGIWALEREWEIEPEVVHLYLFNRGACGADGSLRASFQRADTTCLACLATPKVPPFGDGVVCAICGAWGDRGPDGERRITHRSSCRDNPSAVPRPACPSCGTTRRGRARFGLCSDPWHQAKP